MSSRSVAASVKLSAPTILLMSNLTGRQAGQEITKPNYWRRHVSEAVRFGDSIAALLEDGYRLFLEVGPASTLIGMARRCAGSDAAAWVSSLRKGRNDRVSMLESLGHLARQGPAHRVARRARRHVQWLGRSICPPMRSSGGTSGSSGRWRLIRTRLSRVALRPPAAGWRSRQPIAHLPERDRHLQPPLARGSQDSSI